MKRYLFLFLAGLAAACSSESQPEENPESYDSVPVKVAPVEFTVRTEPVVTAGIVTTLEEVRLSFKTGGIVERVYAQEGQRVRAGQLLASLNMTEIAAQVSQAEFAAAKSERDLARVQNLVKDTAATLEQLENAQTGLDVSRQQLQVAQFNRDYSQIHSPVSGTVVKKLVRDGEVTGPGTPVLVLISDKKSDWVVKVGVSDRDWARLQPGDKADIELDAYPGRQVDGVVSSLSLAADPLTHLYDLEIRLTGNIPRVASGLFAKVKLWPSGVSRYAAIPVEALLEGHGHDGFVFVMKDGKAARKPVKIGYLDQDKVLLTAGLDSADRVITAGSAFLIEGASVHIP